MNTMLEKAIEHWLTNANEKGYQPAFVNALISRGDTVLYNSKHRPLEQGKDVASRDASGGLNAYQLKGLNLDITRWRQWHGELVELVSMGIRHPSVAPGEHHRAYLVTNGTVADEALVYIRDFNADNAARSPEGLP